MASPATPGLRSSSSASLIRKSLASLLEQADELSRDRSIETEIAESRQRLQHLSLLPTTSTVPLEGTSATDRDDLQDYLSQLQQRLGISIATAADPLPTLTLPHGRHSSSFDVDDTDNAEDDNAVDALFAQISSLRDRVVSAHSSSSSNLTPCAPPSSVPGPTHPPSRAHPPSAPPSQPRPLSAHRTLVRPPRVAARASRAAATGAAPVAAPSVRVPTPSRADSAVARVEPLPRTEANARANTRARDNTRADPLSRADAGIRAEANTRTETTPRGEPSAGGVGDYAGAGMATRAEVTEPVDSRVGAGAGIALGPIAASSSSPSSSSSASAFPSQSSSSVSLPAPSLSLATASTTATIDGTGVGVAGVADGVCAGAGAGAGVGAGVGARVPYGTDLDEAGGCGGDAVDDGDASDTDAASVRAARARLEQLLARADEERAGLLAGLTGDGLHEVSLADLVHTTDSAHTVDAAEVVGTRTSNSADEHTRHVSGSGSGVNDADAEGGCACGHCARCERARLVAAALAAVRREHVLEAEETEEVREGTNGEEYGSLWSGDGTADAPAGQRGARESHSGRLGAAAVGAGARVCMPGCGEVSLGADGDLDDAACSAALRAIDEELRKLGVPVSSPGESTVAAEAAEDAATGGVDVEVDMDVDGLSSLLPTANVQANGGTEAEVEAEAEGAGVFLTAPQLRSAADVMRSIEEQCGLRLDLDVNMDVATGAGGGASAGNGVVVAVGDAAAASSAGEDTQPAAVPTELTWHTLLSPVERAAVVSYAEQRLRALASVLGGAADAGSRASWLHEGRDMAASQEAAEALLFGGSREAVRALSDVDRRLAALNKADAREAGGAALDAARKRARARHTLALRGLSDVAVVRGEGSAAEVTARAGADLGTLSVLQRAAQPLEHTPFADARQLRLDSDLSAQYRALGLHLDGSAAEAEPGSRGAAVGLGVGDTSSASSAVGASGDATLAALGARVRGELARGAQYYGVGYHDAEGVGLGVGVGVGVGLGVGMGVEKADGVGRNAASADGSVEAQPSALWSAAVAEALHARTGASAEEDGDEGDDAAASDAAGADASAGAARAASDAHPARPTSTPLTSTSSAAASLTPRSAARIARAALRRVGALVALGEVRKGVPVPEHISDAAAGDDVLMPWPAPATTPVTAHVDMSGPSQHTQPPQGPAILHSLSATAANSHASTNSSTSPCAHTSPSADPSVGAGAGVAATASASRKVVLVRAGDKDISIDLAHRPALATLPRRPASAQATHAAGSAAAGVGEAPGAREVSPGGSVTAAGVVDISALRAQLRVLCAPQASAEDTEAKLRVLGAWDARAGDTALSASTADAGVGSESSRLEALLGGMSAADTFADASGPAHVHLGVAGDDVGGEVAQALQEVREGARAVASGVRASIARLAAVGAPAKDGTAEPEGRRVAWGSKARAPLAGASVAASNTPADGGFAGRLSDEERTALALGVLMRQSRSKGASVAGAGASAELCEAGEAGDAVMLRVDATTAVSHKVDWRAWADAWPAAWDDEDGDAAAPRANDRAARNGSGATSTAAVAARGRAEPQDEVLVLPPIARRAPAARQRGGAGSAGQQSARSERSDKSAPRAQPRTPAGRAPDALGLLSQYEAALRVDAEESDEDELMLGRLRSMQANLGK